MVSGKSPTPRRLGGNHSAKPMPCSVCGHKDHFRDLWSDGKLRCFVCSRKLVEAPNA